MQIKFNPTGTAIFKDSLYIRLDLTPDADFAVYHQEHHIQIPAEPIPQGLYGQDGVLKEPDCSEWLAAVPKQWATNPMLLHPVRISETTTMDDITDYVERLLKPEDLKTLDDILMMPDAIHNLTPFMQGRGIISNEKVQTGDFEDLIAATRQKFAGLSLECGIGDIGEIIEPRSIDVGTTPADFNSSFAIRDVVVFPVNNPANADGTLTSVQIWLVSAADDLYVGTVYLVSGSNYSSRDHYQAGAITSGSTQTISPVAIDVVTGDYIACCNHGSNYNYIERNTAAGNGMGNASANFPFSNVTFTITGNRDLSLCAAGTEAGASAKRGWWSK